MCQMLQCQGIACYNCTMSVGPRQLHVQLRFFNRLYLCSRFAKKFVVIGSVEYILGCLKRMVSESETVFHSFFLSFSY
jgi:hypothetical protein